MKKYSEYITNTKRRRVLLAYALLILCYNIYDYVTHQTSPKAMIIVQCLAGIALIYLPHVLEVISKHKLPLNLVHFYWLFLAISIFTGTCLHFVNIFSWWDKLLHFVSPMLLTMVGYTIAMQLLPKDIQLQSPWLLLLFGFCFAGVCGVLWEFWEYIWDGIADMNLQRYRSGKVLLEGRLALHDTIFDLLTNTLGALCFFIFTYSRAKNKPTYFQAYQISSKKTQR
ncbi:hypothetical protein A4S06_01930 [Erysipelotrichaceae bacterium MTC7]|nr:hypothetical protein A4S06_01930 [Erysipelotrichaceae bacterium MTC7]